MGLVLDILYALALAATCPLWVFRLIRHGRYRSGWAERLGRSPIRYGLQPVIWVHGVSLGEINAARLLVHEIHRQLPDMRVIVSSTTDTGMAAARKHFAPAHKVFQWPLDFTWAVGRALRRSRPDLVVLMEGEAWPNFLAACNRRNIPAVIVNGRMSPDKGYPRYRRLGSLSARLFNRLAAIGVQDESYLNRFLALGVDRDKLHLTGMMKFDTTSVADTVAGQDDLARAMGLAGDAPLLVAGGTGPGEERILLDVYRRLRDECPALRLVIVPRKPERFDEVARLTEQAGFGCIRRSAHLNDAPPAAPADNDVILGDTMGELRAFYALASVAFVGRSLVPMGGSDMIEAAALGRAVAFGPHTFNFPQAEELAAHGCRRVQDADELCDALRLWLDDASRRHRDAQASQRYVRSQQGATRRNVELLCHVLDRRPALAVGHIATDRLQEA